MDNKDIAAVFVEMADLSEIQGGDRYRIRAFRRIGRVLENLREPVDSMIRYGTLGKVPGIGEGAVGRIKEILRVGTCAEQRTLRASLPAGLRDMTKVKGIGVKTVRYLWANERIGSIDELELAARAGRLSRLPGFGEDSGERILKAIEHARRHVGRLLLSEALALGTAMRDAMREEPAVIHADLTGSARRRKETVGDLDILVASHDPGPVIARFVVLPQIEEVLVRGDSKCSARVVEGQQIDLRVIPPETYGAGLHYFTGAQQHNIYLRARGNRRGLKISEHGVFRRADLQLLDGCEDEAKVFSMVGLPFIPPELRENCGEIEAGERGRLPTLVEESALRGELHAGAGGAGSRQATAWIAAARARGLQYLAITDRVGEHEGGPERELERFAKRQEKEKTKGLRLLAGVEVGIELDGTLEIDPKRLEGFDWVVAVVKEAGDETELLPRKEATARLVKAMETGVVDMIAHPTGRIFGERDPDDLDLEKVLKAARRCDVAMEVHGDPHRLDLDSTACRYARELGVPVVVSAGTSSPADLGNLTYAMYTARRGWLEAKDVLNTWTWRAIEKRRRERMRKRGVSEMSALEIPADAEPEPLPGMARETGQRPSAMQRQVDEIESGLKARPLAPELLERLDHFFRDGSDELLEEALKRLGPAPLQKAYELLVLAEGGGDVLHEEPGHEPEDG